METVKPISVFPSKEPKSDPEIIAMLQALLRQAYNTRISRLDYSTVTLDGEGRMTYSGDHWPKDA